MIAAKVVPLFREQHIMLPLGFWFPRFRCPHPGCRRVARLRCQPCGMARCVEHAAAVRSDGVLGCGDIGAREIARHGRDWLTSNL